MTALETPLVRVTAGTARLYGGAQGQLPGKHRQRCGCGLTAGVNLLCRVLGKGDSLSQADYTAMSRKLERLIPLGLGLNGTNGWFLAVGLNLYCLTEGKPTLFTWGMRADKLWARVEEQLARDLPVILAIGPHFPRFWGREELNLYHRAPSGALVRVTSAKAHFLTITALDGDTVTVSSWGRRYLLLRSEYETYVRRHSNHLFSNVMVCR